MTFQKAKKLLEEWDHKIITIPDQPGVLVEMPDNRVFTTTKAEIIREAIELQMKIDEYEVMGTL